MSPYSNLLKIFLILINAASVYVAFTPPNPPPRLNEESKFTARSAGDRIPMVKLRAPLVQRVIFFCSSLMQIYTILLPVSPLLRRLDELFHNGNVSSRFATYNNITPVFLVATSLLVTSGLLRFACYQALGRAFTYQLAVRQGQQLVTAGPYSIVRHPSYTALMLQVPAALLAQMGPGSWWWHTSVGTVVGAVWIVYSILHVAFFALRATSEDKVLRMEFGDQWDKWARQTPYKFVPYVW